MDNKPGPFPLLGTELIPPRRHRWGRRGGSFMDGGKAWQQLAWLA
ncbi:MAG: hypothetical protein RLZZ622_1064 [Planctomycetota bacterium]|jgi:hypothetical protein